MIDLGLVKPGETIYLPWATFAGSTGAASAMTNLAVSDIEIYKNGSMDQRSSTVGFTLLDTDGQDLDTITGINGVSIDLSSNDHAGFYEAGARYYVVIQAVTVDTQTVNFVWGTFKIGLPGAALNTSIASLSSQTSFTLTAGPAEDDALNGCSVYIHDVASAVQAGFGLVSDYTGSTKTVTLAAATTFTAAATDNICVFPPAGLMASSVNAAALTTDAGTEIGAAVWATAVDGSYTAYEMSRIIMATLGGQASGLGTTTALYKNRDGTKTRVTATVDTDGNRTAITFTDVT